MQFPNGMYPITGKNYKAMLYFNKSKNGKMLVSLNQVMRMLYAKRWRTQNGLTFQIVPWCYLVQPQKLAH